MDNKTLKLAIFESRMKNFEIAHEAAMHPASLSHIVNGYYEANETQKESLANVLGQTVGELFPTQIEVA